MNNDEFTTWSVYDSMIQSYRSNMIASQSLLLAVEAILFEKNLIIEATICLIGLVQLWYVWFAIIRARAIISDFHKFNAIYNFNQIVNINGNKMCEETALPLTESVYVKNKSIRDKANNILAELTGEKKFKTNFRITRVKLDIIIPISFTFIWIVLIIFQVC